MSILISNDHLPAAERFDCWRETLSRARLAPVEVRADNEADYRFTMRYADLGATRVTLFTAMPFHVQRTTRLIRESSPDLLVLGMVLRGHVGVTVPGRQADLTPGTFCVYETWATTPPRRRRGCPPRHWKYSPSGSPTHWTATSRCPPRPTAVRC
jgi:hypothetical protein